MDAASKRVRPIIMTTIAMVAGMTPSALGIGFGGEFRSPMAIAVIGGLLVSTLLSLLFVPALFTIMDDVGRLSWRLFGRFVGAADEAKPAHAPSIAMNDKELREKEAAPALVDVSKPARIA
jgi:AcrB/AcrD/AcrF family